MYVVEKVLLDLTSRKRALLEFSQHANETMKFLIGADWQKKKRKQSVLSKRRKLVRA